MAARDPTDNCAPYGTKDHVRAEFSFVAGVRANTLARNYKPGKKSTLIYKAKKDKSALKCLHLTLCICAPCTCSLLHTKTLAKNTYTALYDDRIESNIPISCCCWVGDNPRVHYLDRDFAQNWEKAGPCSPCFTHCTIPNEACAGEVAIGHGSVNFVMEPGGRRIAPPLMCSLPCRPQCQGGPCFGEISSCCFPDWVCYPFLKESSEFIDKVKAQREQIVANYNIVVGKPIEMESKPTDGINM